jgi:branched-chain amino acid transport system ATP-binding protein
MKILEIKDLVVNYGKVVALKGISLEIEEGELVAVIGSNGAGKTTTMNTISGLLSPTSGDILLNGKSICKIPAHQIAALNISHVPEGRKVFASMSVKDNLLLGAYLRIRKGERKQVMNDIDDIYSIFPRLKERENQQSGTLSGGEQQMLALGRALVSKPKLLLLDEPSMGLAPVIIDEVFKLINTIKKRGDMTIFLVEQLAYRALEVADRAYVVEQGNISLTGTGKELMTNPEVRKAYLGSGKS